MKRITIILLVFTILFTIGMNVFAENNELDNRNLVFYDIVTGNKVIFRSSRLDLADLLGEWLKITSETFKYNTNNLSIISVEEDIENEIVTINFNNGFKELGYIPLEANYLISSLCETIFMNTDAKLIYFEVEGNKLENLGELDYLDGVRDTLDIIDDNNREKILFGPDVPNPVIVIDPGHGGIWNNAIAADGTKENEVVLSIAKYLKSVLENKGATVYMTRSTDQELSSNLNTDLAMRAAVANDRNADMFISIHANGHTDTSISGVETFYPRYHDQSLSKSLAEKISASLSTRHSMKLRETKIGDYKVLNDTEMIAVLTEVGFMTNISDYSKMDSLADRDAMAYSIYLGIRKFWWGN